MDELSKIITVDTRFFTNLGLKEAHYRLSLAPNSRKYAAKIIHNDVFIPERCTLG